MEVFRAEIRHIVLMLKFSEEKQRKYKKQLLEVYRTVQKHSIPNPSEKNNSASYTNQYLKQLKEIYELNKSVRTLLRATLIEHHEQHFVNIKKANESSTTLVVENENLTRESQIDVVKQSFQEKCDLKQESPKSQPKGLDSLTTLTTDVKLSSDGPQVNFENDLISIKFEFLTDTKTSIRMGIG